MARPPVHLGGRPMDGGQLAVDVRVDYQRERVLDAAIPLFAKDGYQRTTVGGMIAAAKVDVKNFYSLFRGKEACFLAALDRIVVEARGCIATAVDGIDDWDEQACRGLRSLLQFIAEDPLAARLVLVEAQRAGQEAHVRVRPLLEEAVAWLERGRRLHPEAARLAPSFERAAISGLLFYLQCRLVESPRLDPDALLDEAAEVLLAPILGARRLSALLAHT